MSEVGIILDSVIPALRRGNLAECCTDARTCVAMPMSIAQPVPASCAKRGEIPAAERGYDGGWGRPTFETSSGWGLKLGFLCLVSVGVGIPETWTRHE